MFLLRSLVMDEEVIKSWLEKQSLFSSSFIGTRIARMGGKHSLLKAIHLGRTGNKRKTKYEEAPQRGVVTVQTFDCELFNFTKVARKEYITDDILINVSPLAFGHFLFCPGLNDMRPQTLEKSSLAQALRLAGNFSRSDFKLFFNSLGGWASVNHMHFHGVFLSGYCTAERDWRGDFREIGQDCCLFEDGRFPIEHSKVYHKRSTRSESHVFSLDYILPGLRIENSQSDHLLNDAWKVIDYLLLRDIPHNVLITDGGRCIYIVPRQVQKVVMLPFSQDNGGIHVASAELFGVVICFDESTFNGLDEANYADVLRRHVAVDAALIQKIIGILD